MQEAKLPVTDFPTTLHLGLSQFTVQNEDTNWPTVIFWPFSFAIVFSVLLRFTDSAYSFGIFKLFC
jgi:hypothetical protein